MLRRSLLVAALLVGALGSSSAQDNKPQDRIALLRAELRKMEGREGGMGSSRTDKLRVLKQIAAIGDLPAMQALIEAARSPRHVDVRDDILMLLAERGQDVGLVAALFKDLMIEGGPHRVIARSFLLDRSVARKDDSVLAGLFARGSIEDRFLALEAMGKIGSLGTLGSARRLLDDKEWKAEAGTVVSCATIAASLGHAEGAPAAELLLLLQRESRFAPEDARAVRDATRLWSRKNLHSYIDLRRIASGELSQRIEAVRFMGQAGIETARAPLVQMATSVDEEAALRAAAAEALGGLRIARADLAALLVTLAGDRAQSVRRAALRALVNLRVRQAGEALIEMLEGPHGAEARAVLEAVYPGPNWETWLGTLPVGT